MKHQVRNNMHVLLTSLVAAVMVVAVWAAPCWADVVDPDTGEYHGSGISYPSDDELVEVDPQPTDSQPTDPQPATGDSTSQDSLPLVPLAIVALLAAVGATVAIVRLSGRDAHRQGLA